MGDWFNVVALFSLLVELTGAGEAVAIALLTRFVPAFLAGPFAGVVSDRVSRRAIMVASDLIRAGLVLCLLFVRRPDQVWIAYAVVTAPWIVSAFFEPAQTAPSPTLVPPEDLPYAATLENSLWSITLAAGSALAGIVLALVGRDVAFVLDAASFVGSALFLAGLPHGTPAGQRSSAWGLHDLREGIRYVAGHRRVRALLAMKASFGLTLGGVLVLLAFFGEKVFEHGNGAGIAVLWTARGVGSFLGPFAAFRFVGHDEQGLRHSIAWAFGLLVVCYCGFALSPAIGWAAIALAVANAGGSIQWTSGSTLLSRIVPDSIRGRVAAAEMGGFMLALSASTLTVGLLLD